MMQALAVAETAIPDVKLITPKCIGDDRGYFMEVWNARALQDAGGPACRFVQINQSRSVAHTLRGLHYQVRQVQGKLVRVVHGAIFDVAVDLRAGSPTFGRWAGAHLDANNRQLFWVPPGFAHGFLVTSAEAEVEYCCTDFYAPEHERSIRWDDAELAIDWPLPEGTPPLLSEKDARAGAMCDAEYL